MRKPSPILPKRKKQWGPRIKRHFIIDTSTFQKTIKAVAPPIWDEICGLADALNLSVGEAVQLFGGYYQEYVPSGGSIFTVSQYLIRTYDSHPLSYEWRYALFQPTSGRQA